MSSGIKVSVLWLDDELVELSISASNRRISGEVSAYADLDVFSRIAAALAGFPANAADVRQFEIGTFDPSFAGGGARIGFRCIDGAGHLCAEVQLRADSIRVGFDESASFAVEVEAAAIDAFVNDLRNFGLEPGASVFLPSAEHGR